MQKKGKTSSVLQNLGSLRDFKSATKRRLFLEEITQADLSHISNPLLEENDLVHCENLIGSAMVPLGVAGPLEFKVIDESKWNYIPLATTEGALVASVSRGCKALSESGGVSVYAVSKGQTRGPVFATGSIEKGIFLQNWIEKNPRKLSRAAVSTSAHIKYLKARVKIIGSNTYVRFIFDTKDAMGMNMVTIASEEMVGLITKATGIKCLTVAGNFDIDKKPAWLNVIDGRGYEIWAECVIPKKVLKEILRTSASELYSTWLSKCMVGSYASGSLGYNAHFANVLAAIFIATGQDPAHVVEGSCGITICDVRGDDLYISINIPALLVGTVGGGTVLPTQKAALSIMGIDSKTSSKKLAEIIGGAVLAGELSLLASLSSHTLGAAHKKLGRKKI